MLHLIYFLVFTWSWFQASVAAQRTGTTRGPVFFGCYDSNRPVDSSTTRWAVASSTTFVDGLACANACTASGFGLVSSYQTSARTCKCSNIYPGQLDATFGNQGQCSNNEFWHLRTTFAQLSPYPCRTRSSVSVQFTRGTAVLRDCFDQCKGSKYALWTPRGSSVFECGCTNNLAATGVNSQSITCNRDTVFLYVHSPEAQASQLNRKRRLSEIGGADNVYCPNGFTACNIPAVQHEAYECLDTSSTLDSCGGCMFGRFDGKNATEGVDCTTLPGPRGYHTCANGECKKLF